MRLTKEEVHQIKKGIGEGIGTSQQINFELFLFGSRTKDNLKGGDIDLLILCDDTKLDLFKDRKHILLSRIKKYIGDRKVDLTIMEKNKPDPFLKRVSAELIRL